MGGKAVAIGGHDTGHRRYRHYRFSGKPPITNSKPSLTLKEVLKNQLDDLSTLLGPSFAHVGVGRDDGISKGEHSPIFYDSEKFEEVDWDTIWLSPTPGKVASKGWDAVRSSSFI